MTLDLAATFDWIESELARDRSVAEAMKGLIDFCEAEYPHPDWVRFRDLPYSDLNPIVDWVTKSIAENPPERPLKELWFGLFNPCPDGENPVADIYLCGSDNPIESEEDNSWAGNPFWSSEMSAGSVVLTNIYVRAYPRGISEAEQKRHLGNAAEYPLCLGYSAFAVRQMLQQIKPRLLLSDSASAGVTVGFDSGDLLFIGTSTQQGFVKA